MRRITIENIGPIRNVEFDLNKINVVIGPQSSGKSTIAKIVSFCSWLEKDALVHQSTTYINIEFIQSMLLEFHNIKSYVDSRSKINYIGEILHFEYSFGNVVTEWTENGKGQKSSKVSYIPAERNVVTLPGIESLPFPKNNMRSFLFDWLQIRRKYAESNRLDILNLDVSYYYNEKTQKDVIILQNENAKEIGLDEASSGLQSVIPLYVMLNYLTKWIYNNTPDISFEKQELSSQAVFKEFLRKTAQKNAALEQMDLSEVLEDQQIYNIVSAGLDTVRKIRKTDIDTSEFDSIFQLEENISKPHYSTIIIEEPEQNLFPETQKDLIYHLLKIISEDRDHKLFITTHSPYVLYALNNCILKSIVKDSIDPEIVETVACKDTHINPNEISIWELKDGQFNPYNQNEKFTIQDEDGLIRENYFDRIMKNIMNDFHSLINFYE